MQNLDGFEETGEGWKVRSKSSVGFFFFLTVLLFFSLIRALKSGDWSSELACRTKQLRKTECRFISVSSFKFNSSMCKPG